jgi:hypothetical protein
MKSNDFIAQVATIKRFDLETFKNRQMVFFHILGDSCVPQEFKFTPKFLGYLMGHRWAAPTVLT